MDSTRSVSHTIQGQSTAQPLTASAAVAGTATPPDAFDRLQPDPASQAQILRSYQRDAAQVGRLTELVSELLRSLAGTRWLAHKQTIVDLAVRAVYLLLTFGRGRQTLGEEYTDIMPVAHKLAPTRRRRLLTIALLLLPTVLTSPSMLHYLRGDPYNNSRWAAAKRRVAKFIESPLGQSLPEIHLVVFMFSGRFYEFARRITGMAYISDMPPIPAEHKQASYEPLGLIMALPLLYRLFPRNLGTTSASPSRAVAGSMEEKVTQHDYSGTATPIRNAPEDSVVVTNEAQYDVPNTYLDPEALDLPERQCTLCLESRGTGEGSGGTTAVTECGHIFCWGCLGGLDKMECPLCRQALRMERLVPAYNL
ncbi:hypothetical protein CcaverHIS002_0107540 [Cutaneotrichosporon cavernicola]|uniref:RING-type E3 ubiquitin transferase n=1 Tax=Cutaneotrichosporon cavernicola TaxID=279322 RepID=A0AA48HYW6_9TREE|nr:uncharacterized protein CcaverHIS019_0107490 [Cutaneotrichosporon cavernicola]BEI80225.1 hypothetical protein CcaverHIS002_0107540 [Cutaneotrichosporon cavernicola]BEI88031.1 hypothetical protein CcaverHIS019_0107490 [Cutaneotrichosporon cavernicola]BEI95804.1 hypothetical protein CcaverHIS631_0107530 [Cutaneotrichosporon cavernicola]BEJ03577.1 hypothetical protein CcaverHIS641_0107520 [Cutaneotrichosporon cavernicola]